MSDTYVVHTSGADTNGGGYTGNHSLTWASSWHNGSFAALASLGTAVYYEYVDATHTIVYTTSAAAGWVGVLSKAANCTEISAGTYEITAASAGVSCTIDAGCDTGQSYRYVTYSGTKYRCTTAVANSTDWDTDGTSFTADASIPFNPADYAAGRAYKVPDLAWTLVVGGALGTLANATGTSAAGAIALATTSGDTVLACGNQTTQTTILALTNNATWPGGTNVNIIGVDDATGLMLNWKTGKLPKVTIPNDKTLNFTGFADSKMIGIEITGDYNSYILEDSTQGFMRYGCKFVNTDTGSSSIAIRLRGALIDCYVAGSYNGILTTLYGSVIGCVVECGSGYGINNGGSSSSIMYNLIIGNGSSKGIVPSSTSPDQPLNILNNTIYNCLVGIEPASTSTAVNNYYNNNLFVSCTTAFTWKNNAAGFDLASSNAYYDCTTKHGGFPAGVTILNDLDLSGSPLIDTTPETWDDFRLNPASGDFASLYDWTTGRFIGALGPGDLSPSDIAAAVWNYTAGSGRTTTA